MPRGLKGAGGFLKKLLGDLIRPVRRRRPGGTPGPAAPTPTPAPAPRPPTPRPLSPDNLQPTNLRQPATPHVGTGPAGRGRNRFPNDGGPPNGSLYRLGDDGNVRHYATYDANGRITSRVDMRGAEHGGVPTPHTLRYQHNTAPDGRVFVQPNRTVDPWDASTDI